MSSSDLDPSSVGCGGKSRLAENELAWSDDMRLRCDRGEGRIGGQIVDRTNMAIRNGRRVCSSVRVRGWVLTCCKLKMLGSFWQRTVSSWEGTQN